MSQRRSVPSRSLEEGEGRVSGFPHHRATRGQRRLLLEFFLGSDSLEGRATAYPDSDVSTCVSAKFPNKEKTPVQQAFVVRRQGFEPRTR